MSKGILGEFRVGASFRKNLTGATARLWICFLILKIGVFTSLD